MSKKIFIGTVIGIVTVVNFVACAITITNETEKPEDQIKVLNPKDNDLVTSPLQVKGQARGGWFFEGSFPVELQDANGKTIAQGQAQASDEWMTENFVPFTMTLEFSDPKTETGVLVLSKDNPSDLPENAGSISIPVKFPTTIPTPTTPPIVTPPTTPPAETTMTVKAFFSSSNYDPNMNFCEKTYPVTRTIPKTQGMAKAAILELLKGVSPSEIEEGYHTQINKGVILQSITIKNGIAYVDFNQKLQEGVGGSCKTAVIRSQITETLKQFSSIKNVVISIDGESEIILQP